MTTAELRRRMAELPFRELYEVGGSLRDELLGREPKDIDFLVRGHDVEELLTLCRAHGKADELRVAGRLVGVRFWPPWGPREGIEVVPPRRETPIAPGEPGYTGNPHTDFRIEADAELPVRDDLERRDFTVNAMARDVRTGEWIDPFGGRDDLAGRVLRAVHVTAFRDDPLRILRGVARCQHRRPAARRPHARADDHGVAAHRRACRPSAFARSSSAYSRATAPWTRCGSRAMSARSPWRCPNGRPASGCVQESATQAYTLDEHILHVLGRGHRRGRRTPAAPGGVLARRRQATRLGPRACRGEREPRAPCAPAPHVRQRHDRVRDGARARALLRRGSRAERARRARVPGARGPRARPRPARAATLGPRGPRSADPGRPDRCAQALRDAGRGADAPAGGDRATSRCAATI